MANNDETFDGIALAIGTQSSGFGTVNSTIAALDGALAESDGIILGDNGSGDAETGITLPSIVSIIREQAQIEGSFTQRADEFLSSSVEGFSIAFPLKGNGADAGAPDAGAAKPLEGIDTLLESAGLNGLNGAGPPDYDYTPKASTEYSTIKLWVADLSWVFQDCLVETLTFDFTPGETAIVTADFKVGSINAFADTVTFPTFTWGQQVDLPAPTVEGVAFTTFGQERGFESLKVTIANSIEEFKDSNVVDTGIRTSQKDRVITVDGRIYLETADSAAEYDALIATEVPTDDLTLTIGDPDIGGAETELNAVRLSVKNLQPQGIKYDRTGTGTVVELTGAKATGVTAGSEFVLNFV